MVWGCYRKNGGAQHSHQTPLLLFFYYNFPFSSFSFYLPPTLSSYLLTGSCHPRTPVLIKTKRPGPQLIQPKSSVSGVRQAGLFRALQPVPLRATRMHWIMHSDLHRRRAHALVTPPNLSSSLLCSSNRPSRLSVIPPADTCTVTGHAGGTSRKRPAACDRDLRIRCAGVGVRCRGGKGRAGRSAPPLKATPHPPILLPDTVGRGYGGAHV